jgi:hypothetical protein
MAHYFDQEYRLKQRGDKRQQLPVREVAVVIQHKLITRQVQVTREGVRIEV